MEKTQSQATSDSLTVHPGALALTVLLRLHGLTVAPEEIRRRLGDTSTGVADMLRCSEALGIKTRSRESDWTELSQVPLPGIAVLRAGGFLLLGKMLEDRILVANPASRQPEYLSRAELEAVWDGRLVLVDKRASWRDLARRLRRLPKPLALAALRGRLAPAFE